MSILLNEIKENYAKELGYKDCFNKKLKPNGKQ